MYNHVHVLELPLPGCQEGTPVLKCEDFPGTVQDHKSLGGSLRQVSPEVLRFQEGFENSVGSLEDPGTPGSLQETLGH